MKIGIFEPYNFEIAGGVQDHVRAQAAELRLRGHTVVVITPRPRKYHGVAPAGTVFIGVSARLRVQASSPDVSSLIDAAEMKDFYEKQQFDLVHFHEPVVPFIGRQLIAACPCPVVATLHAALPDTAMGKTFGSITPYFRSIYEHVDVLTRVSSAAGEYLGDELSGIHSVFIPNGIIPSGFTSSPHREPATILYVGRLEKRKGVKYLIMAFAELKKHVQGAKLDIVGDGHDRRKLERLAADLGCADITFVGYVDAAEKAKRLSKATLFCSPALYGESFGIVLLEAMASGAPIVAGNNEGYKTVLKERGLFSLVDPEDTEEFARRLEAFLTDTEFAESYRKWGLEYVKQYNYAHIVDQYESVYQSLVGK